jgi:hypothetical protein
LFQKIRSSALLAIGREEIPIADPTLNHLEMGSSKNTRSDFLKGASEILHSVFGASLVIIGKSDSS